MKRLVMALVIVSGMVACAPADSNPNDELVYAPPSQPGYTKVCKDQNGMIVDNSKCQEAMQAGHSDVFLWWYLLSRPGGYAPGAYIGNTGYSAMPAASNFAAPGRAQSSWSASRPVVGSTTTSRSYSAPSSSFRSSSPSFRSSSPSSSFRSSSGSSFRSSSSGGFRR